MDVDGEDQKVENNDVAMDGDGEDNPVENNDAAMDGDGEDNPVENNDAAMDGADGGDSSDSDVVFLSETVRRPRPPRRPIACCTQHVIDHYQSRQALALRRQRDEVEVQEVGGKSSEEDETSSASQVSSVDAEVNYVDARGYQKSFQFKDWYLLSEDPAVRKAYGLNPDHENDEFTNKCKLLTSQLSDHALSGGCIALSMRALKRFPTVKEFWNNFLNKNTPRVSWYGDLKLVDDESRGWPLKYALKAKVLVRRVDFPTPFGTPELDVVIIQSFDKHFEIGKQINPELWQIEPTGPGNGFLAEGASIEDGCRAQSIVRWFYDNVHFDFDNEDAHIFVRNFMCNRLALLYQLEHPGSLAPLIRGKMIQSIKVHHHLRQQLHLQWDFHVDKNDNAGSEMKEPEEESPTKQAEYLRLTGLLEKHCNTMEYLFNKPLHSIASILDMGRTEDDDICNYDYVLVTKSVTMNDLKTIYEQLQELQKTSELENISDMKTVNNLNEALRLCNAGTTIFVASGNYNITGLGKLEDGGALIGVKISNRDVTISPTDEVGDIWINATAEEHGPLIIKNITFVVDAWADQQMQACIFVSRGKTVLDGCVIRRIGCEQLGEGDGSQVPVRGKMCPLKVNQNALCEHKNCDIFNFSEDDALLGNGGGDQVNDGNSGGDDIGVVDANAGSDGMGEVDENGGGEDIQPPSASPSRSPLNK